MSLPKAQGARRRKIVSVPPGGSCPEPWSVVSVSVHQAAYETLPCAPPQLPLALLPGGLQVARCLREQPVLLRLRGNSDTCRGMCLPAAWQGTSRTLSLPGLAGFWERFLLSSWVSPKRGRIPGGGAGRTVGALLLALC